MSGGVSVEMPRYRCHKEVHALKIESWSRHESDGVLLCFEDRRYAPMAVPGNLFSRHALQVGDYLVVYRDGYMSISPGKEFEDGYTLIS